LASVQFTLSGSDQAAPGSGAAPSESVATGGSIRAGCDEVSEIAVVEAVDPSAAKRCMCTRVTSDLSELASTGSITKGSETGGDASSAIGADAGRGGRAAAGRGGTA
jgi:hypothetical protein